VHLLGGQHVAAQRCQQRVDQLVAARHPTGHRGAVDLDAITRVDAALAVQREVIAILRDHHMRQQSRPRQPTHDRTARRVGLEDALALHARQLGSHVADDLEVRGHVRELLRDARADAAQPATASRPAAGLAIVVVMCGCARRAMDLLVARQVRRQAAVDLGVGCWRHRPASRLGRRDFIQ
jgi:septal ring factor EnvC (AmiA/AmiB activator)